MLELNINELDLVLFSNENLKRKVKECYKSVLNDQLRDDLLFLSSKINDFKNVDFTRIYSNYIRVDISEGTYGSTYNDSRFIECFLEQGSISDLHEMFGNHRFFNVFEKYALLCYKRDNLSLNLSESLDLLPIITDLRESVVDELCDMIKKSIHSKLDDDEELFVFFTDVYIHECMESGHKYLLEDKTYRLIELKEI